jgi:CRISPR-associated protein Cas1
MEPYRPYVDEYVYQLVQKHGLPSEELTKVWKAELLLIPTLDVVIGGRKSPLMVGVTQTTASLYKCFSGEMRKVAYPER